MFEQYDRPPLALKTERKLISRIQQRWVIENIILKEARSDAAPVGDEFQVEPNLLQINEIVKCPADETIHPP